MTKDERQRIFSLPALVDKMIPEIVNNGAETRGTVKILFLHTLVEFVLPE